MCVAPAHRVHCWPCALARIFHAFPRHTRPFITRRIWGRDKVTRGREKLWGGGQGTGDRGEDAECARPGGTSPPGRKEQWAGVAQYGVIFCRRGGRGAPAREGHWWLLGLGCSGRQRMRSRRWERRAARRRSRRSMWYFGIAMQRVMISDRSMCAGHRSRLGSRRVQ